MPQTPPIEPRPRNGSPAAGVLLAAPPAVGARLRDLVALGKPRLSGLVLFSGAIGIWLAPSAPGVLNSLAFLVATASLIGAANMLNCWIEVEIDALMHRTRGRPLPAGRLQPQTALVTGTTLAVLSLAVLSAAAGTLTAGLGVLALVSYVLVYTPLKRVTPWAVLVGGVPGALPPLMGWTAATGEIALPGLFVFGVLFFWHLPHFIAISIYLAEDFRRGGIRVMPVALGAKVTRNWLLVFTLLLAAVSLLGEPLGVAGRIYTTAAAILGAVFAVLAYRGWRVGAGETWARRVFAWSLIYLPLLLAFLVLDAR